MPMPDDLEQEYIRISEALSNWFISQEINTSKAAGAMCYLCGVIIAEHAKKGADATVGIMLHQRIIQTTARMAMEEGI